MTAVKSNEVIEPGVFDPTIEGAKKLIVELNTTIDLFKTVLQVTKEQARSNPFQNFSDVERAAKDMQAADTAAKELAKSEKLLAEATKILENAQKGEIDLLTKNKLATQAATAETKRLAKEQLNLGNAYDQASAKLNNMRREYKDLAVQNRENSKEARMLLSEIHKLDDELKTIDASVGQFQRNVGNYGNAFSSAFERLNQELAGVKEQRKQIKGFGQDFEDVKAKEEVLTNVTASLNREFKTSTQQSRAFQEAAREIGFVFGENSEIFQTFRDEVGKGVDAINDINDSIRLAASDTRNLDRLIGAAQGIAGAFSVAKGATALFDAESEDLQKTMIKLTASMTVLNGLQAVQAELKNKDSLATKVQIGLQKLYALAVGNSTGAMKVFRITMLSLGIGAIVVALSLLIANFDKIKSVLGLGVNPATKKLAEETAKAAEASQKAYEAFDLEEQKLRALGKTELELVGLRRQATKERLEAAQKEMEAQRMVLNETISNYATTTALSMGAGGVFAQLFGTDEKEVQEAKAKFQEMTTFIEELNVKLLELDKKEGEELLNQRREIEDATLAIMQEGLGKALAAEQLAHERRREEAGENYELIGLLEIQHQQNIAKIQKEWADKRLQEEFKYRELLVANMQDGFNKLMAEEQLQYDRRKKDLEGNYKALEQLAIQHEINMAKIVRDRNQVPEEIKAKQEDVTQIVTKGNEDLKKAMEKAQEGITDFTITTANAQASALRQAQKEAERLVAVAEFLDERAQKQADKRLKRIDNELDASKKRADELRQLAIQGDKNAQDSIAAEEKRQAILEQKKEKEAQKAKRRELLLTGINTYNSKVQAGDKNALGSTIRDLSLLAAALNALPGFIEGTENVARDYGRPQRPGKDGYLFWGDGEERILKPEHNRMLGGMSNELLTSIGVMYKNGMLMTADDMPVLPVPGYGDTELLASKLDEVNDSIRSIPKSNFTLEELRDIITHTEKSRNKTTVTKLRL